LAEFLASQPVQTALLIGTATAAVSAVVGVFTVIRGQSFAGHALTDVATAGGSGAFLIGVSPLLGFVVAGVLGAEVMDAIGVQRLRGRDLVTGVVLGASIGLAALLLYLGTTNSATTGATQLILFGSIFTIEPATIPFAAVCSLVAVAIIAAIGRPLLLASVSVDMAAARRVPVRLVGLLFMAALAISVGLSSLTIGAILSTALLIGPAATSLRLTNRLPSAVLIAATIGVGATWLGIGLAYSSYYWGGGHGFPVSFFIVAAIFAAYLLAGLRTVRSGDRRRAGAAETH
jgi:zinc/manganese transport system permease protein